MAGQVVFRPAGIDNHVDVFAGAGGAVENGLGTAVVAGVVAIGVQIARRVEDEGVEGVDLHFIVGHRGGLAGLGASCDVDAQPGGFDGGKFVGSGLFVAGGERYKGRAQGQENAFFHSSL